MIMKDPPKQYIQAWEKIHINHFDTILTNLVWLTQWNIADVEVT